MFTLYYTIHRLLPNYKCCFLLENARLAYNIQATVQNSPADWANISSKPSSRRKICLHDLCFLCQKILSKGEKWNTAPNLHTIYANTVSREADKGCKGSRRHLCIFQERKPQRHCKHTFIYTDKTKDSTSPRELVWHVLTQSPDANQKLLPFEKRENPCLHRITCQNRSYTNSINLSKSSYNNSVLIWASTLQSVSLNVYYKSH